jgi:signal transduction histidine kinase/DNA-binding response OmpR family regulator/ligand-binding sensor domain-containing protein
MKWRLLLFLVFAILQEFALAQNLYINKYSQKDYGSFSLQTSPQNWDVAQDSLGRIYVANSSGIMIYDGLTWQMIPGTENQNLLSFAKSSDGTIYTGGRDFGYLQADSTGQAIFTSFQGLIENKNIPWEKIVSVQCLNDGMYFRHNQGIIEWRNEVFRNYPFEAENVVFELYQDALILQDDFGNLLTLKDSEFDTLLLSRNAWKSGVVFLDKISEQTIIIFTENSGVFEYSGNVVTNWAKDPNDQLSAFEIMEVVHYPELKSFVLATNNAGLIFLSHEGRITRTINPTQGLASNSCYNLFRDINDELWVSLDKGIAKVEYPSPMSFYDFSNGLNGVVNSAIEFKQKLYVGTTSGLYILEKGQQFKKTQITDEVWNIVVTDNTVWIASSSGIFQIINDETKLLRTESARSFKASNNQQIIWVGLAEGLGYFTKKNGRWTWGRKFKDVHHEVRSIAQVSDSVIWISYEKISKLMFNSNMDIVEATRMSADNNYTEDFFITESYYFNGKTRFATEIGLFGFDEQTQRFELDTTFAAAFINAQNPVWALAMDSDNDIWITSNKTTGKLDFEDEKAQSWDTVGFARLKLTDVWRVVPGKNGITYFCTTDGLYAHDANISKKLGEHFYTLLNSVELKGDSTISHFTTDNSKSNTNWQAPYNLNDIKFSYTGTSYNFEEKIVFSYQLAGYDDKWSAWSQTPSKEYTNLPPGKYTFHVKARNLYGIEAPPALFTFGITPPWYRTTWAYGFFGLIFLSAVYAIDKIQRRRLFKRQQAKIRIQEKELAREREVSGKLRKLDKLKDEFLANTSHELRTPLNGIIGLSESLYEDFQNAQDMEVKSNISMIIASGKRLSSLVNSILDYSKLKTESLELRKKPVDLNSIVKVVLTMSRPLISAASLKLVNKLPETLPLLDADENRLQQILYNLVGNAIKFTESGEISVSARLAENFVELAVQDHGIGIPQDKLAIIFDSFEQLGTEINREYLGTGLGLSITKKLVELHGGTIWAESKLGHGSSFKFTMPVSLSGATSLSSAKSTEEKEDIQRPTEIKVRNAQFDVLIVDDEPINRQVLSNHLKNQHANIDMAGSGAEALALIEKKKFDLVLLDIMMPKMSGFEVCLKIREKYTLSQLPVIFITAKDQISDLVEGLKFGSNDYITKPFSKQEFLARIRTHLNLHKINDSYSRFIPHEFLKTLGKESIIEVNLGDHMEKEVTIQFSDIRDYTPLSENMTPKENFEFLNSFLSKMGPIIRNNHGFIVQYLGDGLMSIFLDDPKNAINASIAMLSQVDDYNISRENKSRKRISVGIGLHTGKLMLGVIGDKQRMDVNVVADSVNTASRMEGLTKYYGASIIISEFTLAGLQENYDVAHRFLGLVKVKGKTQPLKIYEILEGLSGEQVKLKLSTKESFENGLKHYLNRDFVSAAAEFKNVFTINKEDKSAQLYLKLSARFMVEGVTKDWDGVETMMLK